MGHPPVQVAIAALDASVRDDIARAVRSAGHRVAVARAAMPTPPGLAGCDVAILAGDVARDLAALRRGAPELPLICVLSSVDPRAVSLLLRKGVAGIIVSAELAEALPATILAVTRGQLCIPRAFAAQAVPPQLSTREKQILGMVVLGFANLEIAQRLVVAESTVKSHLSSTFRKLGVRTRVEAAALILDPANGLGTGILTIPTATAEPSS